MTEFANKTVLVTGGTRGIGFALAQALGNQGARVAMIGTDPGRAAEAEAELGDAGVTARSYLLDVRDRAGWADLFKAINSDLGPVDGLFLNAGGQGSRRNIEEISEDEWQWSFDVNVHGVFNGIRAFLPDMRNRGAQGHVVITSSIAALIPRPTVSAYGASKSAALAIAETLKLELEGTAIGVSVLCPALVQTSFRETNRRHAPGADDTTFDYMNMPPDVGLSASEYARRALDAVAVNDFYVFTHEEVRGAALKTLDDRQKALAAEYRN